MTVALTVYWMSVLTGYFKISLTSQYLIKNIILTLFNIILLLFIFICYEFVL